MTRHYAMYRFNSKEQFESKKDAFNEEVTLEDGYTFIKKPDHFMVGRGYEPELEVVTDKEGNESIQVVTMATVETIEGEDYTVKVPVLKETYLVDVIWTDLEVDEETGLGVHPYGWKTYSVKPDSPILKPLWGWKYVDKME